MIDYESIFIYILHKWEEENKKKIEMQKLAFLKYLFSCLLFR